MTFTIEPSASNRLLESTPLAVLAVLAVLAELAELAEPGESAIVNHLTVDMKDAFQIEILTVAANSLFQQV